MHSKRGWKGNGGRGRKGLPFEQREKRVAGGREKKFQEEKKRGMEAGEFGVELVHPDSGFLLNSQQYQI